VLYCPSILNNVAKDAKYHEITNMSCILLTFFITKTVEKLKKTSKRKNVARITNAKHFFTSLLYQIKHLLLLVTKYDNDNG